MAEDGDRETSTLVAREALYRAIVEDQTELICRFLPDGTYTFVNAAYCRYFGRQREELLGRTFWEFIPESYHAEGRAHLAAITPENPVAQIEHEVRTPNGETRWQQWRDRAFFDEQGRQIEFQAVGRDITDRVRVERALEESRQQLRMLANHVPVHIWMVDEGGCFQFMNARFLAYAGASREAPLRSWMDAVHLEDAGEFAASYRAAVEAGAGYRTQVRLRRHDGEFHWFDVIGLPRFDGERLLGFLGCSIDVTEQRLAELQRSQLEAQRQVAAALREADRRKEEFLWRLSHELRNPLAPMANVVELLRHTDVPRATIDMARDVLSRQLAQLKHLVDERLDVALHGSQVVPVKQAPPSTPLERRTGRRPLRILIVDDNVDYIDTLSDLLRARGHDVVTAADGPSALAAAARGTPDIVLLDLGLPGMDGVEVAERLRAERTCGNALLVAITVYGGQQEALRLACAGFHHHLVKPVDFEQIDALLAERG